MVDNDLENQNETTTTEDDSIETKDDVTGITKDKHDGKRNYYSGTVAVKVLINRYCPLYRKPLVDETIHFNSKTLKSLGADDKPFLRAVPGLRGMYLKEKYLYHSNYLRYNGYAVNPDYNQLESTSDSFQEEFTFNIVNGLFNSHPVTNTSGDPYSFQTQPGPVWAYNRVNEQTGYQETTTRDSAVLYVGQVSSNPLTQQLTSSDETAKGVHWGTWKSTSLFEGEDFFLTFRKGSVSTDIPNNNDILVPLDRTQLDFIDVAYDEPDKTVLPRNHGVVHYEVRETDNGVEYVKREETAKYFNLYDQAYYMVALGYDQDGDMIIFLFTQRANPTCIYAKWEENNFRRVSYNLGSYEKITGEALLQKDKWTMTVRNHLGNLVVYFDGDTDNPWIIKPLADNVDLDEEEDKQKYLTLKVRPTQLGIYGGNISTYFSFNPLTYMDRASIHIPPPIRGEDKNEENKYTLPFNGTDKVYCLFSDTDISLASNAITGGLLTNDLGADDSLYTARNPIFSSDTHNVTETEIDVPTSLDVEDITTQSLSPTNPTYWMTTNKYIKAGTARDNVIDAPGDSGSLITCSAYDFSVSDDKESFNFNLNVSLEAGLAPIDSLSHLTAVTPIVTNLRMVTHPDIDNQAWQPDTIDASPLLLNYSETYSSNDFHTMDHTATLSFLVNRGMSTHNALGRKLEDLRNRAFYVEVWAGYVSCNYSKLGEREGWKLFSGICYGGTLEERANERVLTCQSQDYSKILKESYIFNSPFFDGVRDRNAVYILLRMLGFKDLPPDATNEVNFGPAYLSRIQADSDTHNFSSQTLDGRGSYIDHYALPSSYARLKNPYYKFQDGTSYWDALRKMAVKAGRIMFFDAYGMFHYESLPYDEYLFGNLGSDDVPYLWKYTKSPAGEGQLIFDAFRRQRTVEDVVNVIHLMTTNPEFEILIDDSVNWDSIYDPNSPGFLGYKKLFLQQEGGFGSLNALKKLREHYKKFFKAPIVYGWQSYGLPIRCFDVADIDGQKVIITSVRSTIDPSKNLWWQELEGEWYGQEEELVEPPYTT